MRASAPFATRRTAPFTKSPDLQTPAKLSPELFSNIAPGYDLVNLVLSGGFVLLWDRALRRAVCRAWAQDRPGVIADLGCGTLRFAGGLLRQAPGLRVLGVDPSLTMLEHGLARLPRELSRRILPVQGLAENLPLPAGGLDMASSQFVWRSLNSRPQALAEIRRVLRPGGRVFIMEFGSGQERILGGLYNFYVRGILPGLGGALSGRAGAYAHLARSILEFPRPEAIVEEIRAAGLIDVTCLRLTSGIVHLYTARKPQRV